MSEWIHLSLQFKNYNETIKKVNNEAFPKRKPSGIYVELIQYLKNIVDSVPDLINRFFYLFEENPHLFLALEVKEKKDIELIRERINRINKPAFIDSSKIDLNTGDDSHPEDVIGFFHATTKYAFFRISNDYKLGYHNHDETKLIHCFCNQLFGSHNNEIIFYLLKCLEVYGVQVKI